MFRSFNKDKIVGEFANVYAYAGGYVAFIGGVCVASSDTLDSMLCGMEAHGVVQFKLWEEKK